MQHIEILEIIFCVLVCKGKMLMNILMASVMCLPLSKQEEDVLDHTNVKCHLCIL